MSTEDAVRQPWKLVAPWWRWQRQADDVSDPRPPRQTRPVFQKYDTADFVNVFLKRPQESLKFFDDVDRVFRPDVRSMPSRLVALFSGMRRRFYAPNGVPMDARLSPTGIRKLFLQTHNRHYLVVCELRCDCPGFPPTPAEKVCQSAFAVRRGRYLVPAAVRKEAQARLRELTSLRTELGMLDETVPLRPAAADRRTRLLAKMRSDGTLATERASLVARLAEKRRELLDWQQKNGIVSVYEGWIPTPGRDHLGTWEPIEEKPQTITEATFPLYRLFPDPREADHDALNKTIYFGVVPVGGEECTVQGEQRFDDNALYEIRCFVRRHKPECPPKDEVPDCCGELIWSEGTEVYRLASQNDLVGTSQRPVTIQMPDLEELAAQVAALPYGKASPFKVVQPQGLKFGIGSDQKPEGGSVGPPQICFFAIPLLTIVALFLVNLFLPIIVLVFSLFFLLQLKFCIPPSFGLNARLKAALDAAPPGFDFNAEFTAIAGVAITTSELNIELDNVINSAVATDDLSAVVQTQLQACGNAELVGPIGGLNSTASADFEAGLDLSANVELEPRVTTEITVV